MVLHLHQVGFFIHGCFDDTLTRRISMRLRRRTLTLFVPLCSGVRQLKGVTMSFEKRKEAALQELNESGILKLNSLPPVLILLWKLGIKSKPPHYDSFLNNTFSMGMWFAVVWGVLMWLFEGFSVSGAVLSSLVAGVFFGIAMASYFKVSARKHKLSNWIDLPTEKRDA